MPSYVYNDNEMPIKLVAKFKSTYREIPYEYGTRDVRTLSKKEFDDLHDLIMNIDGVAYRHASFEEGVPLIL